MPQFSINQDIKPGEVSIKVPNPEEMTFLYLFDISGAENRVSKPFLLEKVLEQAGAELGQAQLKLGFDFTLVF